MHRDRLLKALFLIAFIMMAAGLSANSYYKGTGLEGKTFSLEPCHMTGIDDAETVYLDGRINFAITNALQDFTGLQMRESGEKVDYIVYPQVVKNENGLYQFTIDMMDPMTEEVISFTVPSIQSTAQLLNEALNQIIIRLVRQLGIELTADGLSRLQDSKNSKKNTVSSQNTVAKQNNVAKQDINSIDLDFFDKYLFLSGGYTFGLFSKPVFQEEVHHFFSAGSATLFSTCFGLSYTHQTAFGPYFDLDIYTGMKLFDKTCFLSLGFGLGYAFLFESASDIVGKANIDPVTGYEQRWSNYSAITLSGNLAFMVPLKDDLLLSLQYKGTVYSGTHIESFILGQPSLGLIFCR